MNLAIFALSTGILVRSNRLPESNMHGLAGSIGESSKEGLFLSHWFSETDDVQKRKRNFETPLDEIYWPYPGFLRGSDISSIWTGFSRENLASDRREVMWPESVNVWRSVHETEADIFVPHGDIGDCIGIMKD
jgi:hypothetical protein